MAPRGLGGSRAAASEDARVLPGFKVDLGLKVGVASPDGDPLLGIAQVEWSLSNTGALLKRLKVRGWIGF